MRRYAFGALVGVAFLTACTIVTGLHTPPPAPPAPPDADACHHATPPPKPTKAEESGDKEIVVAARKFDLGLAEGAPTVGFDLDGRCTCADDGGVGESCVSATATRHCDDEQGRDNATRSLFRLLGSVYDVEGQLNAGVDLGVETLILRVQRYNGLDNDAEVLVSVYGSTGLRRSLADGGTEFDRPAFDGSDAWTVDKSRLLAPAAGEQYGSKDAREGYVTGHTLVVPQASAQVPLNAGVSLELVDALVVATIDPTGSTITEGTIAGRWPVEAALRACGEIPLADDQPACEAAGIFDSLVKPNVCPNADLPRSASSPTSDPCAALSLAIRFDTVPARLGAILEFALIPPRCHDETIFHCP